MKTFRTKYEVVAFLSSLEEREFMSSHSNGWSTTGQYVCDHGEYDRPDYRPARYKDGWGIAKVPFFYAGTFYAENRHRVEINVYRDGLEIIPVE